MSQPGNAYTLGEHFDTAYLTSRGERGPQLWWRWHKDGRWSRWHLFACGLPKSEAFTMCHLTSVPPDCDEFETNATPNRPCGPCRKATR